MTRHRQSGMAVIIAILLVALAASTAAFMLSQHNLWARQVGGLAARSQADAVARAGIEWVRRALVEQPPLASPEELHGLVAAASRALSIAGVTLEITQTDAQARFNVNNLVRDSSASAADVLAFQRLLGAANLSPDLASAIVDAIDGNSETTLPGGAEDLDYLSLDPPRLAGNRPMLDAAQIARVPGFTPDAASRLLPFLTALPEATSINVNSAAAEAFMLLLPGLDYDAARRFATARDDLPFKDIGAFRARLPDGVVPAPGLAIGVTTRYVLVVSRARLGRTQVAYEALIGMRGAARTGVLWRKQAEG